MNDKDTTSRARPDASWGTPAASWPGAIARYIAHRQVPTWRGRTHDPLGRALADHWDRERASRLGKRLTAVVVRAVDTSLLPAAPFPLDGFAFRAFLEAEGFTGLATTKCPAWLTELRKTVVLNRDGYTCAYCGRTAWEVFEAEGRTLRFELDHRLARTRIVDCDDFDFANIVTACRSCNVMKGQMEMVPFVAELRSLARAVTAKYSE